MAIFLTRRTIVGLLLVLLVGVVWWVWPTEKRAVSAAIDRLEAWAEAADWQGFLGGVSPRYDHEGTTYADLKAMGPSLSSMVGPCSILVLRRRITVIGSRASAQLAFGVYASGTDARFQGTARMVWKLSFRKESDQWMLYKAVPVEVPNMPRSVGTVKDLCQRLGL